MLSRKYGDKIKSNSRIITSGEVAKIVVEPIKLWRFRTGKGDRGEKLSFVFTSEAVVSISIQGVQLLLLFLK